MADSTPTIPVFRRRKAQTTTTATAIDQNQPADPPRRRPQAWPEDSRADGTAEAEAEDDGASDEDVSLARLNKLRKAGKAQRRAGVEFAAVAARPSHHIQPDDDADKKSGEEQSGGPAGLETWNEKFSIQGAKMKEDMNRHMEAFIDQKLGLTRARHSGLAEDSDVIDGNTPVVAERDDQGAPADASAVGAPRPVGFGMAAARIEEVDLGSSVRDRNIARTREALLRRAQREKAEANDDDVMEDDDRQARPGQTRSREDVMRDRIVDQLLSDAKVVRYDYTAPRTDLNVGPGQTHHAGGSDRFQSADERMAEQFRRDFFDHQADRPGRRSRGATRPPRGGAAAKKPTRARGPRLGGSRSARAAARKAMKEGGT